MRQRLFVDTNVLLLAVGSANPLRESCRRLLRAATASELELLVSAEGVQRFCHHRLRDDDRAAAIAAARRVLTLVHIHPFDATVLARMLDLLELTALRGRDAAHAATALEHGFTGIVTADSDFDTAPGLVRISPVDALGS